MFDTRKLDKWWMRAFLALVLFFVWQLFYSISRVQNLDEEKATLQATIEVLSRKSDALRREILDKERELLRLSRKSDQIELLMRDRISLMPSSRSSEAIIYFITPTYFRPSQKADLTRLSYTLSHVPNLHWIVIEDADSKSKSVRDILERSHVRHTHIHAKTPSEKKLKYSDPSWYLPRGVEQRNAALMWIRTQLSSASKGVLYFGDDDNSYDLRLFEEMRKVDRAGVWPVGIVGGLLVETPILAQNGSIVDFNAVWKRNRPFPIDMAAFAVNITLILENDDAMFTYDVPRGYQESTFLEKLDIHRYNMEPLASLCTKVYVWHTRTEKSKLSKENLEKLTKLDGFTDLEADALGFDEENLNQSDEGL